MACAAAPTRLASSTFGPTPGGLGQGRRGRRAGHCPLEFPSRELQLAGSSLAPPSLSAARTPALPPLPACPPARPPACLPACLLSLPASPARDTRRISVMGGEQAATVLAVVESEKRRREGQAWGEGEQEEFRRKIRERCGCVCCLRVWVCGCGYAGVGFGGGGAGGVESQDLREMRYYLGGEGRGARCTAGWADGWVVWVLGEQAEFRRKIRERCGGGERKGACSTAGWVGGCSSWWWALSLQLAGSAARVPDLLATVCRQLPLHTFPPNK